MIFSHIPLPRWKVKSFREFHIDQTVSCQITWIGLFTLRRCIWYNFYSQKTWKHNFQHQLNKSLHFLEPLLNEDKFCNIWFFSRNELWIVMVSSTLECCIIYFTNWTTYLLPLPLRRLMQHVLSCDKRHSGTVGGCFQKLRQLFVLSA
jgi:hypothetical protein